MLRPPSLGGSVRGRQPAGPGAPSQAGPSTDRRTASAHVAPCTPRA
jgi:hypothetical protein